MPLSVKELNKRRRAAVKSRLDGKTLGAISREVGLSAPTITAAMKAWKRGGWEAVDVRPRGRPAHRDRHAAGTGSLRERLVKAAELSRGSDEPLWSTTRVKSWLEQTQASPVSAHTVARDLARWELMPANRARRYHADSAAYVRQWLDGPFTEFRQAARKRSLAIYWLGTQACEQHRHLLFAHDARGQVHWLMCRSAPAISDYLAGFTALGKRHPRGIALVLPGRHLLDDEQLSAWYTRTLTPRIAAPGEAGPEEAGALPDRPGHHRGGARTRSHIGTGRVQTHIESHDSRHTSTHHGDTSMSTPSKAGIAASAASGTLTHLQRLEAESIHIMREVVAEADNPVMLYSVGKDSAVMLHLAQKAFHPARLPFPLLHVDTRWKFRQMYEFRNNMRDQVGFDLLTHINPEGVAKDVNPFTHGSALHTDIMKTEGLKQALNEHKFDVAFGGARRDEEKSRAKERIFSFRSAAHRWEPKNQRPELWKLYNTRKQPGESIRVFPLSNWTELDIWQYIHQQNIPIVPLYLAAERPVVERDGTLIMVDDERMPLKQGEVPTMRRVRFRTLGCYPLTGAVESSADTLPAIIQEMLLARTSERQGRMIDHDSAASMEKKKQEGYF